MSLSQTIIITGGNTGLGFAVAMTLASDQSKMIVIACRDPHLGRQATEQIKANGGHAIHLLLDLGDQAGIRRFADVFRASALPPLYGIVCNAGMQNVSMPQKTIEGYETTFAVNHLGHYLLVRLLLDDLLPGGHITLVSSGTHDPKQRSGGMPAPVYKDAEAVAHDFEANRNAGLRRYTTSKLCNIYFTYELARRLAMSGDVRLSSIIVNAIDPGLMPATGLARSWPKPLQWVSRNLLPLVRFVSDNVHRPQISGERVAALTVGREAAPGGRYFSNGRAIRSSDLSYDERMQEELWNSSAKMTGLPIELVRPQSDF